MTRGKAIQLIYGQADKKGWNYYELHSKVEELNETHTPYIRLMSPYELSRIALRLFGKHIKVEDVATIKKIREQCKKYEISMYELEEYIDQQWMKNKKISSIYHLNYRQLIVLESKILKYIIDKKIDERMKDTEEL